MERVLHLMRSWKSRLIIVFAMVCYAYAAAAIEVRLPESVELTPDIPYAGTENPRQTLDLLLPRERSGESLPVIVFVHGGAWRHGDKRTGLGRLAKFVESGKYAAVSVGYRLSGEAIWPAQIHDCKAAIRWVRANAEEHHLDPDRIGVWGSSAGGHLVAMLGTSGDVESLEGELGPHAEVSSRVACVVDFYGPTDLLRMNEMALPTSNFDHDAADSPESLLLGGAVQEQQEAAVTANPLTYVTQEDPPFLIVHGTQDPLVPIGQSKLLDDALAAVNVESTLVTVEGGLHGANFGRDVLTLVRDFFAQHLLGKQRKWEDQTVPAVGAR